VGRQEAASGAPLWITGLDRRPSSRGGRVPWKLQLANLGDQSWLRPFGTQGKVPKRLGN
jgi:hypothetical protein